MPMKIITKRLTPHSAMPSVKFGMPMRAMRQVISRDGRKCLFFGLKSRVPLCKARTVKSAPTTYEIAVPAAMPITPHFAPSMPKTFGTTKLPAWYCAPDKSQEAIALTTLTTTAIHAGVHVSPAPCKHIDPTVITPVAGIAIASSRTY